MITSREMEKLHEKTARVYTIYGEILEGDCVHDNEEYLECEFGLDEEGLHIADHIVLKSQIAAAEEWDVEAESGRLRAAEIRERLMFSLRKSFSEHLKRWEDNEVPDKYDHNAFEYSGQPSKGEFMLALEYQRERGDGFIKLEGREPLEDSFGLGENAVLTMVIEEPPASDAETPARIEIREPRYKDLQELESKHYGSVYGEDFCARNTDELYEFLDFRGAYIGDRLVGSYHWFNDGEITIIDGLLVDEDYRNKGIGTALIKDAAELAARLAAEAKPSPASRKKGKHWVLALHADRDDRPREMYEKMGFVAVDTLYEYLSTDLKESR